jgi:hypothetical protein
VLEGQEKEGAFSQLCISLLIWEEDEIEGRRTVAVTCLMPAAKAAIVVRV